MHKKCSFEFETLVTASGAIRIFSPGVHGQGRLSCEQIN